MKKKIEQIIFYKELKLIFFLARLDYMYENINHPMCKCNIKENKKGE